MNEKGEIKGDYGWTGLYMEFADRLRPFQDDRTKLIDIIGKVYSKIGLKCPTLEKGRETPSDIDPFTVFGLFNKGLKAENRIKIIAAFKEELSMESPIPTTFDGIPVLNNLSATFYRFKDKREERDIDNLWDFFIATLDYADNPAEENLERFKDGYEALRHQKGIKWNLTMGMYWMRPFTFLNLDGRNRWYITESGRCTDLGIKKFKNNLVDVESYLELKNRFDDLFRDKSFGYTSYPDLSYNAWAYSEEINRLNDESVMMTGLSSEYDVETDGPQESDERPYTKTDFLDVVFLDESELDDLITLLQRKGNLILQGPPGVGKTYVAKRLAYAVLGRADKSHVSMVQFHQSYSYEDFIAGYRPTPDGYEIKHGPFYRFCSRARGQDEKYFFIIDEINRGNLSKIFGELMMLLENDKRENAYLPLLYADEDEEPFTIPKNVYIIGTMNTADRSLALIDYALRRRFAFFDIEPAFEKERFIEYCNLKDDESYERLVREIIELNKDIAADPSLGRGYRIGHSYLVMPENVEDVGLKAIVDHEIIPLLEEYWFDDARKLEEWKGRLHRAIQ